MKKLFFLIFISLVAISCTDDNVFQKETEVESGEKILKATSSDLIIPKGAWENWADIKLANLRQPVFVPWNSQYATSSIPDEVRKDIKAEDGWKLLRNSIIENKPGSNYLIFYNQFTGVLKGFYYLETASQGNNGYWKISFGRNQKLLYNQDGFFTYPLSYNKNIESINVMNITQNPTKGFTVGWNCFQVELAYDANQPNLTILIDAYQQNIGSMKIEGAYESTSSGTIISTPSVPSTNNADFSISGLNAIGDNAKDWITSHISEGVDKKPIKDVAVKTLQEILSGNIKNLVNLSANLIFGSMLGGGTDSEPNNYTLQFKTSGKVTLSGKTELPQTTSIPPIQIGISSSEKLGVWNLSDAPQINIGEYAKMKNVVNSWDGKPYIVYRIRKMINTSYNDVLINENIKPYLSSYRIERAATRGHLPGENYNPTSASRKKLENRNGINASDRETDIRKIIYDDGTTKIYSHYVTYLPPIESVTNYIDILPHWISNETGRPVLNLSEYYSSDKLHMSTEDLKIVFIYWINVNGKLKSFKSIRTYDPRYGFYSNEDKGGRPYGWSWNVLFDKFLNKIY